MSLSFWELHSSAEACNSDDIVEETPSDYTEHSCGHGSSVQTGPVNALIRQAKPRDLIWPQIGTCLIQDHVLQAFRKQGFTGFDVRPATCTFKRPNAKHETPILWQLLIEGWGGLASSESGVSLVERCDVCGAAVYLQASDTSQLFDESQWDGSDFFIIYPFTQCIFVSNRVAKFITDQGYTGLDLTPMEHVATDPGMICTAGPLREVFPEERARLLGEPLGIY